VEPAVLAASGQAVALDQVTFGTNWKTLAEHGSYYQAVADGTYERH
jgi:NitT/TauT family transport system substrate-binding protein